jgi:hypothetical protein
MVNSNNNNDDLQNEIDETNTTTMNLENLQQQYNNLLISYQQAVANYSNQLSSGQDPLVSMIAHAFNGTGTAGPSSATTLQNCIATCSTNTNCTGATFVSNQCLLRTGNSPIVPSTLSSFAIVPESVKLLFIMENINQQLIDVNQQITNVMNNANDLYDTQTEERSQAQNVLINSYTELEIERENILNLLKEYENLDNTSSNDQILINQRFYTYVFLTILAIVVIYLLFKLSYPSANNTQASTVQYGGDLGKGAYFILFLIIFITAFIKYLT